LQKYLPLQNENKCSVINDTLIKRKIQSVFEKNIHWHYECLKQVKKGDISVVCKLEGADIQ
ncbi:hypothetical protein R0K17_25560, partial [Planococcus sp. SIMBA_143]